MFVIKRDGQFYNLYTSDGPIFTPRMSEAFQFDLLYKAQNVVDGDERLRDATIEEF